MENKRISWLILSVCMILIYAIAKFLGGDGVYCGWFWGLILVIAFCALIRLTERTKVRKILMWLGKRSLEIYLANCILVPFLFSFSFKFGSVDLTYGNYFYYFLVIIIGFPLAEGIRLLSDGIRNVVCLGLESKN